MFYKGITSNDLSKKKNQVAKSINVTFINIIGLYPIGNHFAILHVKKVWKNFQKTG